MICAQRLLQEPEAIVSGVSLQLSFENASYFTRVFKRHTGQTPTDFQRSCQTRKPE